MTEWKKKKMHGSVSYDLVLCLLVREGDWVLFSSPSVSYLPPLKTGEKGKVVQLITGHRTE